MIRGDLALQHDPAPTGPRPHQHQGVVDRRRDVERCEVELRHFPFPFLNVPKTEVAAVMLTTQVRADPEQPPPLQPVKVEPFFGVAVRVTTVPLAYASEQSGPQLMPDGVLVTVPGPDSAAVRV
jgi:hypothetical protein